MIFSLLSSFGNRFKWVLRNCLVASAAQAVSGAIVGVPCGLANSMIPGSIESPYYSMVFVAFWNAVWSIVLGLLVSIPVFLFLFGAIPEPRQSENLKTSRREVFRFLIFPSAVLQVLLSFALGALFLAVSQSRIFFQSIGLLPVGGNVGDILVRTQYSLLLLGSIGGGAFLALLWQLAEVKSKGEGSRLLPLD